MADEMPLDRWIAVSRSALRHNVEAVQARLREGAGEATKQDAASPTLIAVVKANAYGHGAVETARIWEESGVGFFAVTTPEEALELRDGGITSRILTFAPALPGQAEALVERDVVLTVADAASLDTAILAARATGQTARAHLKIDSGMGRLGVLPSDALALALRIVASECVQLEGVYTHLGRALEADESPSRAQFGRFERVIADLRAAGIEPGLRHAANSAALLRWPGMWLDAVRPGTILYGQYPSAAVPRALDLRETWSLRARIVSVRDLPVGTAVGYGGEFVTRRPTRMAIVPVGYADGFTLAPASASHGWRGLKAWARETVRGRRLSMSVRGQSAPVLGRVAMQMTCLDVTDIPDVAPGDEVIIPARRITASARLPRIHLE